MWIEFNDTALKGVARRELAPPAGGGAGAGEWLYEELASEGAVQSSAWLGEVRREHDPMFLPSIRIAAPSR